MVRASPTVTTEPVTSTAPAPIETLMASPASASVAARSLPAHELAEVARGIFGQDRVSVSPNLVAAIDEAAALAEVGGVFGEGLGSGGVLVTGSVITVGEARTVITHRGPRGND